MATEITWVQAVLHILGEATEPMSCGDIAEEILGRGLKTTVGKTPSDTVAGAISRMRSQGTADIIKVRPGFYQLVPQSDAPRVDETDELDATDAVDNLAVAAYGLHWERGKVDWSTRRLLGYDIDPNPEQAINFADQQGVYLLHSWQSVVYVGKTTARAGGLFNRLQWHHQRQVWSGKWERFSWFGIRRVNENGEMDDGPDTASKEVVSALMEAVLIETLRPSFNQQQGSYMGTLYRQAVDPNIAMAQARALLSQAGPISFQIP